MKTSVVDEYNDGGHLIWSVDYLGAYVRGRTRDEALRKFPSELTQYLAWIRGKADSQKWKFIVVQEKRSDLQICDADSDVLFDSETPSISLGDYLGLKTLALRSAKDFEALYRSIPDKDRPLVPLRKTFYGMVPRTAMEMYEHTKNVNSYYFHEIGVPSDNESDIYMCRFHGFEALEKQANFLDNNVFVGDYDEKWSLRKVCRRFVWHDRIHGKAMYRNSAGIFEETTIANPFCFVL